MTVVVVSKFKDALIMLADSRASFDDGTKHRDQLQKLIPLNDHLIAGYAGDVDTAKRIIDNLWQKLDSENVTSIKRITELTKSSAELGYSLREESVSIFIAGRLENKYFAYRLDSPDFTIKYVGKIDVIGSGEFTKNNLKLAHASVDVDANINEKVHTLSAKLRSALVNNKHIGIGGMLQTAVMDQHGLRPFYEGYFHIDPDDEPDAKMIEFIDGAWQQKDLTTGKVVKLMTPLELMNSPAEELTFYDHTMPPKKKNKSKFYLTYLLTCLNFEQDHFSTKFHIPLTSLSATKMPFPAQMYIAVGFWGSTGKHAFEAIFRQGTKKQFLIRKDIDIPGPYKEIEILEPVELQILDYGLSSIDCYIDGKLLGRRHMYVGKADKENTDVRNKQLLAEQSTSSVDKTIVRPSIEYFFIGTDESIFNSRKLEIRGQFSALYWEKFPLKMNLYVTASILLPAGDHVVTLEVVAASTHETYVATEHTIQQKKPDRCRVKGFVTVNFKTPNFYYVNVRVNNKRIATILLPVETSNTKFSYDILPENKESVKNGELFVLAKRPTTKPKS